MKVFHSWDKTLQEPFLTKHLKLLISGKDVFPSWNFPNTAPTRSYLLFLSWSQILWMEGLPCIEKNEFPYFLKICRKLGDQVGYSLHLLHCRLFCDKSKSQKKSQDLDDPRYKRLMWWRGPTSDIQEICQCDKNCCCSDQKSEQFWIGSNSVN